MAVEPYTISVPQDQLDLLEEKLRLTTWPDHLEDAPDWDYGAPLRDVQRLAQYWRDTFDWRAAEARLNALPNHRTKIAVDGFGDLDIHFVHQTSDGKRAIPLLFVHGWPGSFVEVAKLLPLLKTGEPSFHVVALSLPNFGFSSGVKRRGFALAQYAETANKLMLKLGYKQYVTQGGDWGFYITRMIGLLYPQNCLASHINMIRASAPTASKHPLLALQHALFPYSAAEKQGLERMQWFLSEGAGYRTLQATKPQTIGYAQADSPVALLAWIYEKLHDWTDAYPWTDDEVLTWVCIYWFSAAGPAASSRIYYEAVHAPPGLDRERTQQWIGRVKYGLAYFPKELGVPPKTWGRTLGNVVLESRHEHGGHFAAHEQPQAIVDDLRKMFGKKGPCAGIVPGRRGY